jgi:hypothetical protein
MPADAHLSSRSLRSTRLSTAPVAGLSRIDPAGTCSRHWIEQCLHRRIEPFFRRRPAIIPKPGWSAGTLRRDRVGRRRLGGISCNLRTRCVHCLQLDRTIDGWRRLGGWRSTGCLRAMGGWRRTASFAATRFPGRCCHWMKLLDWNDDVSAFRFGAARDDWISLLDRVDQRFMRNDR